MTVAAVRTTELPSGEAIPVLGQGTWGYAEDVLRRREEIAALREGIDLGLTLIDTAEAYAGGDAEELVGEAIAGRRDEVFLVSKVQPFHATRDGTIAACRRSLDRLSTDRLDLYLLHWRGRVRLEETLEAFDELRTAGSIRYWGVSNFGLADMAELVRVAGGPDVAADQVLYNLARRGIEHDLLPWCLERAIPLMAYSPFQRGQLLGHPVVAAVAARHGVTPAQVALAWVLRHERMTTIPRARASAHVRENHAALDVQLPAHDLFELDKAFPAPTGPLPLAVL